MRVINIGWLKCCFPEIYERLQEQGFDYDVKSVHWRRRVLAVAVHLAVQKPELTYQTDRFMGLVRQRESAIEYFPPLTSRCQTPFTPCLSDEPDYHVTPTLLAAECELTYPRLGAVLAEVLVRNYFQDGNWILPHRRDVVADAIRSERSWWQEYHLMVIDQPELGPYGEPLAQIQVTGHSLE